MALCAMADLSVISDKSMVAAKVAKMDTMGSLCEFSCHSRVQISLVVIL